MVDTSPHFDALGRRGVRFADCTVQWPKTWPSMASLLTGRHPRSVGVTDDHRHLRVGVPTIAEILQLAGYATAAVVTNATIGRAVGYARGFEHFSEPWRGAARGRLGRMKEGSHRLGV